MIIARGASEVEDMIASIDIGTSKICTLIGYINSDNQLVVSGKGVFPCNGIKKGTIINIESTSNAIKSSIEQAESMANVKVESAYISIPGMHVSVINNTSSLIIPREKKEITRSDVEKLLRDVRNVEIPEDMEIIDVITRQYIIDGYDGIMDPVGMVGTKLEVEADIVAGKITSVQNIVKSVERLNIDIDGLVLGAFAEGEILLSNDEKDMGIILIDVGGGITDVSVYQKKKLIFYDSIPVGGDHITNDISIGLKIPYVEAERIKRQYELALTSLINHDQEIMVMDINEDVKKNIKVSEVVEIIEARVYEIFSLCVNLLVKANIDINATSGVVLTGGGISYVDGCKQLATEIFNIPVRIASYRAIGVSKPEFAVAAGMIKYIYGLHRKSRIGSNVKSTKKKEPRRESSVLKVVLEFLRKLFL